MSPFDLLALLRVRPFEPLRIYASDGRTYNIHHPDQAMVLLKRVILPIPTAGEVPERSEHLALNRIVRVEQLASPATPKPSSTE